MKIKRSWDDAGRHQTFVLYPECHIKWLAVSLTVSYRNPSRIPLSRLTDITTSRNYMTNTNYLNYPPQYRTARTYTVSVRNFIYHFAFRLILYTIQNYRYPAVHPPATFSLFTLINKKKKWLYINIFSLTDNRIGNSLTTHANIFYGCWYYYRYFNSNWFVYKMIKVDT